MRRCLALLSLALLMTTATAAPPTDLLLAARSGDLTRVKQLLADGTPVDAADTWGTTALYLAARHNQLEVVQFLLIQGADPAARETFFGTSALTSTLREGAPDYAVARALLAAGAPDRAQALGHAMENAHLSLARAAVAAGPVTASEAAMLHRRLAELNLDAAWKQLLAGLQTVADPPPPTYTPEQLQVFAGSFAGEGRQVTVTARDGRLELTHGGKTMPLAASGDRTFTHEGEGIVLRYFGRAGTVEGISLEHAHAGPLRLRLADAPIQEIADLPAFIADPNIRPTVHWQGFRGTNRAGVSEGAATPVEFDLESGKAVAWSVPIPGLANSSPVVWGDMVFVTTAVAEGGSTPLRTGLTGSGEEIEEQTVHSWQVLALDKRSGRILWTTQVGRGLPLTRRHFKATQANSSPATDGQHVVVVFPTAGLACLGLDGAVHWKRPLGGLNAGGFNDPGLQWGFAASPIIHDGKVILQVDIHEGAYLAAWDLRNGTPLWHSPRPDVAPSWATPAIWPTPSGDQVVVNASIIRGYDPGSGEELWSLGPTSVQVVASPVIHGDHVIVSSGYPPARPIYALKPGIRGAHTIRSEKDAGPLAWYQTRGGAYMPTPLLYRGLLYMVHHNGRLTAHDPRNGARVYQARFSAGGTMTASPVAGGGHIYQGSEEGQLYVLAAGPAYRELAVHDFAEPLMATPALSQGLLLVRTPSRLVAIGQMPPRADTAGEAARRDGAR